MALKKGFVQGWTTAFVDVVLAHVLEAVAGISIFGVEPFAGLQAWADELMDQAAQAFSTAQTAQSNVQTVTDGIAVGAGSTTTTGNSPTTVSTHIADINSTATDASGAATSVGQQVNSLAQILSQPGYPMWWTGGDPTAEVTFPYAFLPGSPSFRGSTASSAPWAFSPMQTSGVKVTAGCLAQQSGAVTGFFIDLFQMNTDGSVTYVASTADMSSQLSTSALNYVQANLSTSITVASGDTWGWQFRMTGSGTVNIAGITVTSPAIGSRPAVRPANMGGARTLGTATPATLSKAEVDAIYSGSTPWGFLGSMAVNLQRYYYDDFNRSSLGSTWLLKNNSSANAVAYQNQFVFYGTTDGTEAALWYQQTITDAAAVEFDVTNTNTTSSGAMVHWKSDFSFGLLCAVYSDRVALGSGNIATQTLRATYSGGGGDGHFKVSYDPTTNAYSVFKNGVLLGDPWVDSSNVMPHGGGYRYGGLFTRRFQSANGGSLDNFSYYDM